MGHWLKRAGWFVALWLASVALLAVIAYGIRLVIMSG